MRAAHVNTFGFSEVATERTKFVFGEQAIIIFLSNGKK